MSITKFTTKEIARLSSLIKLELTAQELKQFTKELPDTLSAIANLNQLKTEKIAPTYQTTGITNRFQNESLNERVLSKKAIFKNTVRTQNGYFQIKGLEYSK